MSAPRYVDCFCGHNKMSHEVEAAPACCHDKCGCQRYRANTGLASRPAPPIADEKRIAAGKRSAVAATRRLAERIEADLARLSDRLVAEREAAEGQRRRDEEKAAARARIADLERRLAVEKAALRGKAVAVPAVLVVVKPNGDHACTRPDCDRTFVTTQARSMHERRAHDGFNPKRATA